ncbi:hypothetical protein A2U01_0085199, partial [Trifolium medium]|nr:hypothetical protein [Trifolium medium]
MLVAGGDFGGGKCFWAVGENRGVLNEGVVGDGTVGDENGR